MYTYIVKNFDQFLGIFQAESQGAALDQFARAHGFKSYGDAERKGLEEGMVSEQIGMAPGEKPYLTIRRIAEVDFSELKTAYPDHARVRKSWEERKGNEMRAARREAAEVN
jgi:hypothetical protein